jgi:hypothetical protein
MVFDDLLSIQTIWYSLNDATTALSNHLTIPQDNFDTFLKESKCRDLNWGPSEPKASVWFNQISQAAISSYV